MKKEINISNHPCFNAEVKGKYGRIHLPVAPKCNIQCNYCNRKYDCVNESRPGVTSAVVTPWQAVDYLEQVLQYEPNITTVGIAGPGDPFANPEETLLTLELIRKKWPHLLLCIATNGLALPEYIDKLDEIGISHVTITINAIAPEIGQLFYSWIRDKKAVYRGIKAASLILERQLESVERLKEKGIIVKVNTIIVPWLNDKHAVEIAEKLCEMDVDLMNCMPMYPNKGTMFEHIPEPSPELMNLIRNEVENYLPQMRHCSRCRADAVGLLSNDKIGKYSSILHECSQKPKKVETQRQYAAIATLEGALVNQHLGHAEELHIYKKEDDNYTLIDVRKTPEQGTGGKRWFALASLLQDCSTLVVNAIGETPRTILEEEGIRIIEMYGLVVEALDIAFNGKELKSYHKKRSTSCAAGSCKGEGVGCG
jgi:nitrogen fixation protein NifB